MVGLSSHLYKQCRTTLLRCDEFESNESLRAIFAVGKLKLYRDKIPEAIRRDLRVDQCLEFLQDKYLQGEPVLALFIEILRDRYPKDEDLHNALHELAKEIRTAPINTSEAEYFDVMLRYFDMDAKYVESIAKHLKNKEGFHVCLDKWLLEEANQSWQQEKEYTLSKTNCCAICIGEFTPTGWIQQMSQEAINQQRDNDSFEIIPVLLPNVKMIFIENFPDLKKWADFRNRINDKFAFQIFARVIKNEEQRERPIGNSEAHSQNVEMHFEVDHLTDILQKLNNYKNAKLIDESVSQEYQLKVLEKYLK